MNLDTYYVLAKAAGVIVTVGLFSVLYKENKFYRFCEHLFLGLAAGWAAVAIWTESLRSTWYDKMIGTVDEAVGMLGVKLRSEAGDGRGLGVASGNVGVEIWIAVENFAVVADFRDHTPGPHIVESKRGPVPGTSPQQPSDRGIVARRHLRDVGRRDAPLLGGNHREHGPAQDIEQVDIFLAHELCERLA